MTSSIKATAGLVALLVAACGAACGFWVRPKLVAGRQCRNWADIRILGEFVDRFHETNGRFPATLQDAIPSDVSKREYWTAARDVFGNPLHYEVVGGSYLIASYGQDGVRDRELAAAFSAPCMDADVDTVISSDGRVQGCGK